MNLKQDAIVGALQRQRLRVLPRWRIGLVVLILAMAGWASLTRALQEPSMGWRFDLNPTDQVRAASSRETGAAHSETLDGITALRSGQQRLVLRPELLVESGGMINRFADQARFYADQQLVWQMLQGQTVEIEHRQGSTLAHIEPKRLGELGPRFWFPWLVGLLSLSVGLGIWLYSPQRRAAWYFLMSSASYAFAMLIVAPTGSRLLTQDPAIWRQLYLLAHGVAFVQNIGLALLLWNFPSRLGGRWFTWALLAYACCSLCINFMQWVDTVALAFRLPVALFGLVFLALFTLQWRAARGDPVKRAQLRWLTLLFVAGQTAILMGYLYAATGAVVRVPQVYGLGWLSLLYLGLVPLVTRVGLFQLEAWWVRAWLWILGGLLVVALDLLLVNLLSLPDQSAVVWATALAGWVYFPVRQWLWRKLAGDRLEKTQALLPDIVALSTQDRPPSHARWLALWDRAFEPATTHVMDENISGVSIAQDGRLLRIPGGRGLQALELELAERGKRLFVDADAHKAHEIVRLVQTALGAQQAFADGAQQERARIASDLHDDLGALLLSITHSQSAPSSALLARQAMDELRLAVRSLTAANATLDDCVADWRAEIVARLAAAGIAPVWSADLENGAQPLPASPRIALTRILREAVSNVIKHSGANQCDIRLVGSAGQLTLEIADDGKGMPVTAINPNGLGLPNLERRARKLGGQFEIVQPAQGGVLLRVVLPLPSVNIQAP